MWNDNLGIFKFEHTFYVQKRARTGAGPFAFLQLSQFRFGWILRWHYCFIFIIASYYSFMLLKSQVVASTTTRDICKTKKGQKRAESLLFFSPQEKRVGSFFVLRKSGYNVWWAVKYCPTYFFLQADSFPESTGMKVWSLENKNSKKNRLCFLSTKKSRLFFLWE